MKADIKEKWVAALRSGKYNQGRAYLKDAAGNYCCLGVLCDILPGGKWRKQEGRAFSIYIDNIGEVNTRSLNLSLLSQIDLPDWEQHQLIGMNDTGREFKAIADYIEGQL
jgi:hypothetical protein